MLCFGKETIDKGSTFDAAQAAVDLCRLNPITPVLAVGGNCLALACELRRAILACNCWSQVKYIHGALIPFKFENGSQIYIASPDMLFRQRGNVEIVWIDQPVDQPKLNNAYLAYAVGNASEVWVSDRHEKEIPL